MFKKAKQERWIFANLPP